MDTTEIQRDLIEASQDYYDYLDKTGKGLIVSEVLSVRKIPYKKKKGKEVYRLNLNKKLKNLDNVSVRIRGEDFKDKDIDFVLWDDEKRDFVIAIAPGSKAAAAGNLELLGLDEISVVSDLKYLVERVKQWYIRNPICFPQKNALRFGSFSSVQTFNDCSTEQSDAVCFALTNPFSYIWGAPGTGKTKYVLANCVMNYLVRGDKVYVLAPTNNAVEQALSSIIELADLINVPRESILRMGAPSREFAERYPETCELSGLNYVVKTQEEKQEFFGEILAYKRRLSAFLRLKDEATAEIARLTWEAGASKIIDAPPDFSELDRLVNVNPLTYIGVKLDKNHPEETFETVLACLDAKEREIREDGEIFSAYEEDSPAEIEEKLGALDDELRTTKDKTSNKRMAKALVIGGTIDAFIGAFTPGEGEEVPAFEAKHIFFDEAGYGNVAKVMTVFAYGKPVTFFGDHFQLPPVCEMDDETISRDAPAVFLWSQSALYIGDMFESELNEEYKKYFFGGLPDFDVMPKFDLTTTYRFGQNMLDVLGVKVYGKSLKSVEGKENLIIQFVDAPKSTPAEKKRENPDEAIAVRGWLRAQGYSKKGAQSVAVLTPYKNQVAALKKLCFPFVGDEIYSVHGSQGREWDTVVLSVCDTRDMFFVDSENRRSKGKMILNTAISRAKKRLVIACDYKFWSAQDRQLICLLLRLSSNTSIV